jgi:hypothetical protein
MFEMKIVCAKQISAFMSFPEWLYDAPLSRKLEVQFEDHLQGTIVLAQ